MGNTVAKFFGLILTATLLAPCVPAHAAFQKLSQAMQYQMFAPADGASPKTDEERTVSDTPSVTVDGRIEYDNHENYNRAIAERHLKKANSGVNINANSNRRFVSIPLGKKLTVNLIEEVSQVCTYECNDKILKYSNGNKDANVLTIVFNAENPGRTKLYVDCVTNSSETGIKVESKVFDISVD